MLVSFNGLLAPLAGNVPDTQGLVVTSRHQKLAARVKFYAAHPVVMANLGEIKWKLSFLQ